MTDDFRPSFPRRDNHVGDEAIELEGTIEVTTQLAYLVNWSNGGKGWIPKSCVLSQYEVGGGNIVFEVKEWWAKKNGHA